MSEHTVTNSTCLISLERIGRLDLLPQVFATVTAPPAVQAEFGVAVEWLIVKPVQNAAVVATLKIQIDDGEAYAIALAMELGNVILILDDKKARRIARQLGFKVMGTIGVLMRAKRRGVIPAIEPLLTALENVDFHMTPALREEALRLCGEDKPPKA